MCNRGNKEGNASDEFATSGEQSRQNESLSGIKALLMCHAEFSTGLRGKSPACPDMQSGAILRHHDVDTGIGRGAEPLMWRPGLTQIRVHELASELNVSTQQVLTILVDLGHKVRGPSTVIGVSAAARVRGRFRLPKAPSGPSVVRAGEPTEGSHPAGSSVEVERSTPTPGSAVVMAPTVTASAVTAPAVTAPAVPVLPTAPVPGVAAGAGHSLFLPPVAPAGPVTVARSTGAFSNPFTVPAGRAPRPSHPAMHAVPQPPRSVANRVPPVPPVTEPEPDFDALWEGRGISRSEKARWLAVGLRPSEAELADRCRAADIAPDELPARLSGRTALQRLRDGEASTSVWARIREAEQQPRRAGTKLTGRFQLS